ncbi:alpha/beta hydrolase [Clostridium sp. MSJ-11]|uniref:Alpha/beta hydrolase n=1 Tax=Clostridium mobile TaxID=2841512 RepID=A0ABS6EH20_9CLOT|nr:alpha/beta hydrolase [Clostridium mobile]MBU5484506.1 alpha/beta hydrolase [Clostridium mobile]
MIASVNKTKIYYEIKGEGTPLIFIPGLGATHTMYKPQVDFFSKEYKTIVLDLRGTGKSGELNAPIKKGLETQSKDVADLMNQLNVKKAVFIGVSYGGVLTQKFYSLFPEKVMGMVIVDSFTHTHPKSIKEFFNKVNSYNILAYYLPKKFLSKELRKYYEKRWGKLVGEEMGKIILEMRTWETVKQRLEINSIDYRHVLQNVNVPVLGIVGDHTKMGVEFMKSIIDEIPHEKLEIFEDSFDPSNLCKSELFNNTVNEFLVKNKLLYSNKRAP